MSGAAKKQGAKSQVHPDNLQPSAKSADSTDTSSTTAAQGGSSEEQQDAPGSSDRPSGSPEPNCSICLGALENKSFTDSCFHMFCFVCLQEWSKVKPECPLCKQPFKSIIHNVKSYNNYDQFYLDHHPSAPHQPMHFGWNFDRSFRYRTTLTMDHRYVSVHVPPLTPSRPMLHPDLAQQQRRGYYESRPYHMRLRSRTGRLQRTTTHFRREIYATGRRVSRVDRMTRMRTVSPWFFRSNPAQTHRLVPWLNRELNALLHEAEGQVTFVLELIMGLIKRFPIDSDEFYEHIHPYMRENTRHFMHEFLFFARSPFCMETYDTKAVYEDASTDSSSNSDVVVVDDDDAPEAGRPGQNRNAMAGPSDPQSSISLWEEQLLDMYSPAIALGNSGWDSPTPGPSWGFNRNSSQSPVNVMDSSDSDASTIIDPSFIHPETPSAQPTRSRSHDDSDGDEVIFISYDKPWEERSPIQLSSGSDDETYSKFAKKLKREHKKKRARSSAGTSRTDRHCRSSRREYSRSLTPPAAYHNRSRSPVSRSSGHHDQYASSHRKSKQHERCHQRKHRSEGKEGFHHSPRSSHSEKRTHSTSSSSSRSANKKHHSDKSGGDGTEEAHGSQHKKHRHKRKHKRNKDKSAKHLQQPRQNSLLQSGSALRAQVNASSSAVRDEGDRCKKHPSGHKRSRVQESGSREETGVRQDIGSHHSDGLLSDTSTSSSSSTTTTTSTTSQEHSLARYFSREQRLQRAMQAQHLPSIPSMDVAPSWENISRLARLLASHTSSQLSSEPVIIASSDESEGESPHRRHESNPVTGDNISVAKTVVVPCSSRLGVPTPAIDFSGTTSGSASRLAIADECIDVDSISSDENISVSEVVDVESLEDTGDSSTEPVSSSDAQEADANSTGNSKCVTEVSAEAEHVALPVTLAAEPSGEPPANPFLSFSPFSIESILNRDRASTSSNLSASSYFPCAGQVSVNRALSFYSQLKGKLENDAAHATSLPGGIYIDEGELIDTDSDVEIIPRSPRKTPEVLNPGTAENSHHGAQTEGEDIDVVSESAHADVADERVGVEEQPPSQSSDPASVVSAAAGVEESSSAEQQSPSQSLNTTLIANESKDADSTDSAIGSSPVDQDDSSPREDKTMIVQQTAEDAGHSSTHQGVEASGSAAENNSAAPFSSSSGCDLPSTSPEEPSNDVSLGDTDSSDGESDISVGEADISVGGADNSVGEADISVGESDISVGDELPVSQNTCADEGIGTQQDMPNITDHSVEGKAHRGLDGSAVLASNVGTSLSKITTDFEQDSLVAAASTVDGEDGHCQAD